VPIHEFDIVTWFAFRRKQWGQQVGTYLFLRLYQSKSISAWGLWRA
jgi:hypothetical protein